ncbi:MAG: PTS glucose transporter subunit IIA [Synergistaceae bacterium]|nr:PTS glucose transporter subunit IIA [Synergistaceae bacterium]
MDFKELAALILEHVGGKSNVKSVVHCATRLRFTLSDASKADTEKIKKAKGVLSVVNAGGQYQIVIGPDVPQLYQEVISLGGFEAAAAVDDPEAEKEDNRSQLSKILESIAGIFQPIIPAITGAGLLKALMALFAWLGWLKTGTQTYTILNAMADAAFYFMPVLLAASCARKFKCNQGNALALAGILVYPSFMSLMSGKEAVTFLGFLPVTRAPYASSVIPIILGVWFMSIVEHWAQKVSPRAVKFFSVPLASLLIGGTVTITLLGPVGAWASGLINSLFTWMNASIPWLVPTLVGIFSPLLVMTGTHYGLIPIGTNNLATVKWDSVVIGMLPSNIAQGAAGLAVALRSKNPDTKQQAGSAGLTAVLGITEPVLYGVNMRFTFPLYAAMIGGGLGGLYMGLTRVARFAGGSPGLLVLPGYIPHAEGAALGYTMTNFMNAVIGGVVIAFIGSWIACNIFYDIWAKKGKIPVEELKGPAVIPEVPDNVIVAAANGKFIGPDDIKDAMFSEQSMGQTVAVEPSDGVISAPANGKIEMIFETGHAFGMRMPDGTGLLIHIGVDTVNLKGQGFTVLKKEGDNVKAGEPVVRVDLDVLRNAGYSPQTMIVITEPVEEGKPLTFIEFGKDVSRGDVISL